MGYAVAQLFEALRYKGSISDGVLGIFHRHNPSGLTLSLGSTQPLTEMSSTDIPWGGGGMRPMFRADNLTTFMFRLL